MRNRLVVLRAVHPFPSVLVALLTVALVPLADREAPPGRYLELGLGMLLFQFAIGLVNDVVDFEEDRRTKPWKPLARGFVTRRAAALLALCFAGASLLLTLPLPWRAWLIGVAGLGCGLAYDLYFKRTPLSWLPYSLAFPLAPAWVYVAADRWHTLLWWTPPLGALLGFALHLANQAPDAEIEDDVGLPGRLGERGSRTLALVVFAVAAAVVSALLLVDSRPRAFVTALVGLVAVAAGPRSSMLGRTGLFGLLAVASAVLAVVFLSAA